MCARNVMKMRDVCILMAITNVNVRMAIPAMEKVVQV